MRPRGIGVLIIEAHAGLRALLRAYVQDLVLEARVFEAESIAEARRLAAIHRPDVVLVDVAQRDGNGLTLAGRLRLENPASHLVVVTAYDFEEYRRLAAAMGAVAYIGKDRIVEDLPLALEQAIALLSADSGVVILVPAALVESATRLGRRLRAAGTWIDGRARARGRSIWLWRLAHTAMMLMCLEISAAPFLPIEVAPGETALALQLGAVFVGVMFDLRRLARVPMAVQRAMV